MAITKTKIYVNKNVYTAANERIDYVFKNFEKIYLSFSGGKDSGVMLNLVADYMRKHDIKKKIGLLYIDLEGQYSLTIEYIRQTLTDNADLFDVYWCCLPINLRNAVSVYEPFWTPWDPDQRKKWIRPYPDYPCITEENHKFPFFRKNMEFEAFVPEFGKWYAGNKKTACLVGIRSDGNRNSRIIVFINNISQEKEK